MSQKTLRKVGSKASVVAAQKDAPLKTSNPTHSRVCESATVTFKQLD